jgi:hypothetical protein
LKGEFNKKNEHTFILHQKSLMVSLHVVARENDASISFERWQLLAVLHA